MGGQNCCGMRDIQKIENGQLAPQESVLAKYIPSLEKRTEYTEYAKKKLTETATAVREHNYAESYDKAKNHDY